MQTSQADTGFLKKVLDGDGIANRLLFAVITRF